MNQLSMNEKRDKKRLVQLGKHIQRIRKGLGISLDELASRCDVDKSNLSLIENGKKDYAITILLELSRGLDKHPKLLNEDFDFLKDWD